MHMNPLLEDATPETAETLHAHAKAQGLSVDAYLRALLGLGSNENALADMSEKEFAKGTENVPPLPPDFSRDQIPPDLVVNLQAADIVEVIF
jgi:hypothetical protein